MPFYSELPDLNNSVIMDLDNRKTLLIIFGGIAGHMGLPPFEFSKILTSIETDKVFIRDVNQTWYQSGLPGICNDFDGIKYFLDKLICKNNPSRVTFIGNSAGGFAAIALGHLLGIDKVVAFSPQTFITRWGRLFYLDRRWRTQIRNVYKHTRSNNYLDLKRILNISANVSESIEIHYCSNHRLDKKHAERLIHINRVNLVSYHYGDHSLVKHLKDNGKLLNILKRSVSSTD